MTAVGAWCFGMANRFIMGARRIDLLLIVRAADDSKCSLLYSFVPDMAAIRVDSRLTLRSVRVDSCQ